MERAGTRPEASIALTLGRETWYLASVRLQDVPGEFLASLYGTLHAVPDELRFNRRKGWMFSTWRWVTLLAPEGVSPLVRSVYPDAFDHRGADRQVLETLRREAPYLVRGSAGGVVHRARILHPDPGPIERANVILIDLQAVGRQLESYEEFLFKGALEVYDRKTDRPLVYRSGVGLVQCPTPPGFRTVEDLKARGLLRRASEVDK